MCSSPHLKPIVHERKHELGNHELEKKVMENKKESKRKTN